MLSNIAVLEGVVGGVCCSVRGVRGAGLANAQERIVIIEILSCVGNKLGQSCAKLRLS